jgi:hypothetical protein
VLIIPDGQWQKGEPRLRHKPGRKNENSGVKYVASDTDFNDFARQIGDAIAFLEKHSDMIRMMVSFPGVEDAVLDFGIERRDVAVQCDRLPAKLVSLAGNVGLAIEISQYPIDNGDTAKEEGH